MNSGCPLFSLPSQSSYVSAARQTARSRSRLRPQLLLFYSTHTKHKGHPEGRPMCLVRITGVEPARSPTGTWNLRVCQFRHIRIKFSYPFSSYGTTARAISAFYIQHDCPRHIRIYIQRDCPRHIRITLIIIIKYLPKVKPYCRAICYNLAV